jgi:hypothetical protein
MAFRLNVVNMRNQKNLTRCRTSKDLKEAKLALIDCHI